MRRLALVSGLLVLLGVVVVPGSTASSQLQCGAVVTTDVVLTEDLVCPSDGLVLTGTGDVTVDLNGHSITGAGSGTGVALELSDAPDSSAPIQVTVESGTIRGFATGLSIHVLAATCCGRMLRLDGLNIRENGQGIVGTFDRSGTETLVSNSVIAKNRGDGVALAFGAPFSMVNDEVRNNGGNGIRSFRNSLSLLANSFVAHNGANGALLDDTVASISGNTFLGNGETGLAVHEEICAFFPLYVVSNNLAEKNAHGGMSFTSGQACSTPPAGAGNAAKQNGDFQCVLVVCARNRGGQ
jgi:parallel beta helix pectate lyase-like protein